jgi:hypothetical protein
MDDLSRARLLNLTTLEILSKVYMALEDLGKILISGTRPPRQFAESFVTLEQKRSLAAFEQLSGKPGHDLYSIFPLWKPEGYGLKGNEAKALSEYNQKIAIFTGKVLAFFADSSSDTMPPTIATSMACR